MTTEANQEIVRRWFDEVIGQRQIDLIDEIFSPEVVNWAAVPERRYGIEGMKDIARFIFDVQPLQRSNTSSKTASRTGANPGFSPGQRESRRLLCLPAQTWPTISHRSETERPA